MRGKKAQVWIETAIYTLIGLVIIAILLSIITPQIDKAKDRSVIEQTIEAMRIIDNKIFETVQSPGNIRIVEFKIGKGKLDIDSINDSLIYILENSRLEFSQSGIEVKEGKILIKTTKKNNRYDVMLTLNYKNNLNITYENTEKNKIFQSASIPYKVHLENIGDNLPLDKIHINFETIA
jgi:hypothetical protein